jgi:hypothetical protein
MKNQPAGIATSVGSGTAVVFGLGIADIGKSFSLAKVMDVLKNGKKWPG